MKGFLKKASVLAAAAGIAAPAEAQMYGRYGNDDWGWGWGHMIFGPLMMIVFWGGLIIVVVLTVRWLGGGGAPHRHDGPANKNNALEILRERFARGEIDKEEFEERRRLLSD